MRYGHPLEIPKSSIITGLKWIGDRRPYDVEDIHGDTYPVAWGQDGDIYTSAGDPNWIFSNGKPRLVTWEEAIAKPDIYPDMGGLDVERIVGDPENYRIKQINTMPGLTGPGGRGPKPTGMISVQGKLYLAVQNLLGSKPPRHGQNSQHGTDASIFESDDLGKTWKTNIQSLWSDFEKEFYNREEKRWINSPEERQSYQGWKPMFPGNLFGGPSFIQFGQDNKDAIDSYVYAVSVDQWDNGNEMRLGRVPNDQIMDSNAWKWACIQENGDVNWVKNLKDTKPVLIIERHLGVPEMIYLPSIKRYLLFTWGLHHDFKTDAGSELTVLESKQPWGPFKLVYYEEIWDSVEVCPYCPRVPLKWFNQTELTGWLLHSGNWWTLDKWYKAHIKPFKLVVE